MRFEFFQKKSPAVCVGCTRRERWKLRWVFEYSVNKILADRRGDAGGPRTRSLLAIPLKRGPRTIVRKFELLADADFDAAPADEIGDQRIQRVQMKRSGLEFGHVPF